MDRYSRGPPPTYGQHPPPPPPAAPPSSHHDPHRPPPPHYAQPAPHSAPSSHHPHPPQHAVAPSPQQQHQPPPPQHHPSAPYSAPPPTAAVHPPPPRAQPYPPQQHQQHPYLPPIQPGTYAAAPSSSEQSHLPPYRPSSAQPSHEQQREGQPPYPPERSYSRSGHATPAPASAPVNRTYSHDSGQQRTPATPTAPPHFSHSSGHDGAQQPPSGAPPPPPPPQSMDHGGHPGYPPTNGVPHHGMHHAPPPHHEQHPQYAMTPMMDQHHQYPPPGQAMYGGAPSYGPTASMNYGPKRKQMRATQACEQCRQRKQKCDEGTPCSFCKENNLSCAYRDTPPAKTDKNMEKLLSYMDTYQESLTKLSRQFNQFDDRLQRIEQNAQSTQHSSQVVTYNHTMGGAEQVATSQVEPYQVRSSEVEPSQPQQVSLVPSQRPDLEDHRTAPHKLLHLWPSVVALMERADYKVDESYVMEVEDRGTLRLWTRGEGYDVHDGTQPGPASPAARSDESPDGTHISTPSEGLWGTGFPCTPGSYASRSDAPGVGGLKANGQVDLDALTVNKLYDSYIRNIHTMHPFLDETRLRKMFNLFIERYSGGKQRATWAVSDERPSKRQRSNGSGTNVIGGGPSSDSEMLRDMATERSPGNVIVYLVLALGKICLHESHLPHIHSDSRQANTVNSHSTGADHRGLAASSPMSINFKQSPRSPKSMSTTQPTPPAETHPRMHDSRSRRSSFDGSPSALGPRNLDVIPGLAYYARAAEILGAEMDGNQLVHAQMFLLAGLYKGQLARVKESMSFYTMAGRVCLILLDRRKLWKDKGDHEVTDVTIDTDQAKIRTTHDALVVMAAHTSIQLESDILAEMRLPHSGMQNYEDYLLAPRELPKDDSYDGLYPQEKVTSRKNILFYYSAQMFLRKRLNSVHRELYGAAFLGCRAPELKAMITGHQQLLEGWRNQLRDETKDLRWNDEDPPARDFLTARVRAKYWGARYVVYRPFLDYALHIMPYVGNVARQRGSTQSVENVAVDGNNKPRNKFDIQMFKVIELMGEENVWDGARNCVEAAMQSTVAFDGIIAGGKRLIVTNIHGTAHAQFGNMLVLSAVYNSPYTKHLVPAEKLKRLLTRTIRFLQDYAPISPTCRKDCSILEAIQVALFGPYSEGAEPMEHDTSSSAHSSFRDNMNPSPM